MRWRKYSEGLPDRYTMIRYNNGKEREAGRKQGCIDLYENGWVDIEWLDQTQDATDYFSDKIKEILAEAVQKGSIEFAKWMQENDPIFQVTVVEEQYQKYLQSLIK